MNDAKRRFIELLQQDIDHNRKAAAAWDDLAKKGGRLEDADGKTLATATEMAARFRSHEEELKELISKVRD